MASSSKHLSTTTTVPLASRLKNASKVYGYVTPPNEEDDGDCTRFIGRCLVELNKGQQQQNERLQEIERYNGDTPSSTSDKVYAIWEEIGDLKSKVERIEDRVQDVRDDLTGMEEKIEERFDTLETEIGDLASRVDSLESKVDSLESRFDSLESKFDKFMFEQDVWGLRQRNSLASRLYQPVQPVGMSYINADGKAVLKVPTWPIRRVGYYWKMHKQENHKHLVDAHRFYQLDFRHWALSDDEESDNSYETDDLNLPVATLEQAVSMYPDKAVMALFNELGLVYSRFQEHFERQQLRPTVLQKRSPKDTSSKSERRVKKPNSGSSVDLISVATSPTASASFG